jgi:hypothetical protein
MPIGPEFNYVEVRIWEANLRALLTLSIFLKGYALNGLPSQKGIVSYELHAVSL